MVLVGNMTTIHSNPLNWLFIFQTLFVTHTTVLQAQYGSRGANPTSLVARLISEGFGKAPKKKKGSIKE